MKYILLLLIVPLCFVGSTAAQGIPAFFYPIDGAYVNAVGDSLIYYERTDGSDSIIVVFSQNGIYFRVHVADSALMTIQAVKLLVEDSLNEYALTSAMSSTYETITNVGKIGDDTTTWKAIATQTATDSAKWRVPEAVALTNLTATAPLYKASAGVVACSTATATLRGVAKFKTDNFAVASGEVTIKSGGVNSDEIANGTIEPVDLNQSSKFNFNAGFYLNDSTKEDSLVKSKKYIDDKWEDAILENPIIYGDVFATGFFNQQNWKFDLDTTFSPYAMPADTFLEITVYDACDTTEDVGNPEMLHPGMLYVPGGWPDSAGPTHFMGVTPYSEYCLESVMLRVSWDGLNWQKFYNSDSTDSCPDPIWHGSDFPNANSFLSDADVFLTEDNRLGFVFRAKFSAPTPDEFDIIMSTTADGITWDSTTIIDKNIVGFDSAYFLSPCIYLDKKGLYSLWAVEKNDPGENTVLLYQAPKYDSGWAFVDTCDWEPPVGDRDIWHIEVIPYSASQWFAIVATTTNGGAGASGRLYGAYSKDPAGLVWETHDSVLLPLGESGAWDDGMHYRSSGFWVNRGEYTCMELYYTGNSEVDGSGLYRIGRTYLYFKDSAVIATEAWVRDSTWGFGNVTDTVTEYLWASDIYGNIDGPEDSCRLTFGVFDDLGGGAFEIVMARDSNVSSQANQRDDLIIVWPGFNSESGIIDIGNFYLYYKTSSATAATSCIDSLIILGPSDTTGAAGTKSYVARATFDSANVNLADTDGKAEVFNYSGRDFHSINWQPAMRVVIEIDAGAYVDILRASLVYTREITR